MQQLWYYFLRTYVWVGLHIYFRKIIVQGARNIPKGPVIFAANHQNAFLDALMIVCFNKHTTHFLARADIFNRPLTSRVLRTLNMFPIFRIRDGWKSLTENQRTFEYCLGLFQRNEAVVIFPEGNHGPRRNLRPLSKGFTRVASASIQRQPDLKIHIVPVGLNYADHPAFRSAVSIIFGLPILANDYIRNHNDFEAGKLRDDLTIQLKQLITHVEDSRYDEIIERLEQSSPNYLDPADTNDRVSKIERDVLHATAHARPARERSVILPLHFASLILNFVPLFIWALIKKKIKDPVLVGSIKFGVGIFLFPFFYLLVGLLVHWNLGLPWALAWILIAFTSVFWLKEL